MVDLTRVSVVIPTYNRRVELLRAIASVLAQETPVFEIVVVDDASNEDFHDVQALDSRIRVVRHDTNRGGAVARNTGVQNAAGEYVAFLDSDDTWLPHKMTRQLQMLQELGKDTAFVCCNVLSRRVDAADRSYNRRAPRPGEELSEYFLANGASFQTSGLVIPRALLLEMPFDPALKRHQDWDLVLRMVQSGCDYRYSHEPLAVYWDASDAKRISRQPDPGPTLAWFSKPGISISPAAKAYFYGHFYFPPHLRRQPLDALSTMASLTTKSPRAFTYGIKGLATQVANRIRPGSGH
jgi:glycosyltransferase involved in cell wall biosynthesis